MTSTPLTLQRMYQNKHAKWTHSHKHSSYTYPHRMGILVSDGHNGHNCMWMYGNERGRERGRTRERKREKEMKNNTEKQIWSKNNHSNRFTSRNPHKCKHLIHRNLIARTFSAATAVGVICHPIHCHSYICDSIALSCTHFTHISKVLVEIDFCHIFFVIVAFCFSPFVHRLLWAARCACVCVSVQLTFAYRSANAAPNFYLKTARSNQFQFISFRTLKKIVL